MPPTSRRPRWYAEKSLGGRRYERHPDQPEDGFADIGEVMAFLEEQGEIAWVANPAEEDGGHRTGWGDPWHAVRYPRPHGG